MDLVTRLLLQTGQFDSNIQKSTRQIQSFQNAGSAVTGAITKLAGGLGLAMGAVEGLKRTINSTQSTGDAFVKMTAQSEAGLNSFFVCLASGSGFASFISNLQNAINKAGDLADVLDNLETKSLFSNAELDDLNTQKTLSQSIVKDRSKSDDERNAALEKSKKLQAEMLILQRNLAAENKKGAYATLDAGLATHGFKGNVERNTLDYMLKESNRDNITQGAKAYNDKIKEYQNSMNKHITMSYGQPEYGKEYYSIERNMIKFQKSKEGQIGKLFATFIEMPDDEKSMIAKAINLKKTANAQYVAIAAAELEINNAAAKINGSWKTRHGITSKDLLDEDGTSIIKSKEKVINKGSIDEIDAQLTKLSKSFAAATSDELRASIQTVINKLEAKKFKLQFKAEYGSQEDNLAEIIKQPEVTGLKVDNKIVAPQMVDTETIKPVYSKKDVSVNNDYIDSLNAISNVMGSITNLTNEGATAWLSWSANLLTSIAMAIPAISALIAVKKTEAVTNGVASATQTPLVGWLLGGAAAISVVAALASIPKFASGGIVGGNSYSGDNILAGLNSGEMVLNKNQQGNLFSILNGSSGSNNASNSGSQAIELKVKGTDLVATLNNYNKKTSKIR